MKSFALLFTIGFLFIQSCDAPVEEDSREKFPENVGDIDFDPKLDDPHFKECSEISGRQYYNGGKGLNYDGEKKAIITFFEKEYKVESLENQNGYITIRFIVNCERETGRFRVSSMDMNYEVMEFDKRITEQLLSLTKKLDGWNFPPPKRRKLDYYQYLTFKIEQGQITEIMP